MLARLRGHDDVRALLSRTLEQGNLPHSLLFHGEAGIGKERLGLWLAQLLVCEVGGTEPCDSCQPCRLVRRLEHPDVHWFFPLPRPEGASTPEKLREKLEDQRAGELQMRRDDPHHVPHFDKAPAHFLASVRTIQQLASVRPSMGRRKVFVIGDAELMVPQESSQEAANAFLKLLEEPPPETTFVLTSSQPGALLATIRSRLMPVRLRPLEEAVVLRFLQEETGASEEEAARISRLARGSIGLALRYRSRDGETAPAEMQRRAGRELLVAALSTGGVARSAAAHARRPSGARAQLVGELDALVEWLRDLLAVSSGAPGRVGDPEALRILERAVAQRPITPGGVMNAILRVGRARELAYGNVNPQLIVADLLLGIQRDLGAAGKRQPSTRR